MKIIAVFEDKQEISENHPKKYDNVEIEVTPRELLDTCDETTILERLESCSGGCYEYCECNSEYEYFGLINFKYVHEDEKGAL